MAERSVQTAKHLIRFSTDLYAALLAYPTTPLENGYSPAQLLYSRQLCSNVPTTIEQLRPEVPDSFLIILGKTLQKQRQKSDFDSHHRARNLPTLPLGSEVFLPDRQEKGHVVSQPATGSYIVSTPSGEFRQNRRHINQLADTPQTVHPESDSDCTEGNNNDQPTTEQPHATPLQPPSPYSVMVF